MVKNVGVTPEILGQFEDDLKLLIAGDVCEGRVKSRKDFDAFVGIRANELALVYDSYMGTDVARVAETMLVRTLRSQGSLEPFPTVGRPWKRNQKILDKAEKSVASALVVANEMRLIELRTLAKISLVNRDHAVFSNLVTPWKNEKTSPNPIDLRPNAIAAGAPGLPKSIATAWLGLDPNLRHYSAKLDTGFQLSVFAGASRMRIFFIGAFNAIYQVDIANRRVTHELDAPLAKMLLEAQRALNKLPKDVVALLPEDLQPPKQ